jgi:WD40 repeat protein
MKLNRIVLFVIMLVRCMAVFGEDSVNAALSNSVLNGNTEMTQFFLDTGADPDFFHPLAGMPLLTLAIVSDQTETAKLLIYARANVEAETLQGGFTPLMAAAEAGNETIAWEILYAGADVDKPNDEGVTALMLAVASGNYGMADILLQVGASPTLVSNGGFSALGLAKHSSGDQRLIDLLLRYCGPSSIPILRPNLSMHTGRIGRIAADISGRYAVTASFDKTAKLWNLETGELIKTYRVPIGELNEGRLDAAAITPDGKTIALGGWTGYEWSGAFTIYILDRESGSIIGTVGDFNAAVGDLEFSPNGKYLAATLTGREGVRIIDTSGWNIAKTLGGYANACYNCAFSRSGQFATVSYDGYIRLYDSAFRLVKSRNTGKRGYSVAFSPDGSKLAIGFDNSPEIEVCDAATLRTLYNPNITGASSQYQIIHTLAFSSDSRYLYGGGAAWKNDAGKEKMIIRWWDRQGRGGYQDFLILGNALLDLKALPEGNLLFCGGLPEWGVVTADGKPSVHNWAETYDFHSRDRSHFRLSPDGKTLGFTPFGGSPKTFSLENRTLSDEQISSRYRAPTVSGGGTRVSNWDNSFYPRINGKAVGFLIDQERGVSVDVHPSGGNVLFGTQWHLYYFDSNGNIAWNTQINAIATAVNILPDAGLCAALLTDGTVHWYNLKDGTEIAALYVHPETGEWLLYTPSGFYDTSGLYTARNFGWHQNGDSGEAALFYSLDQFRNIFYRPDLFENILRNKTTPRPETAVFDHMPPVIKTVRVNYKSIVFPENDTYETVTTNPAFSISVEAEGENDIDTIEVYVNGRVVSSKDMSRGLRPVPQIEDDRKLSATMSFQLLRRDTWFRIFVKDKDGFLSREKRIHVTYTGSGAPPEITDPTEKISLNAPLGRLHLLSVGMNTVSSQMRGYGLDELRYAEADAKSIVDLFTKMEGSVFSEVETYECYSTDADTVLSKLDAINRRLEPGDRIIISLAGHGLMEEGEYFFLARDSDPSSLQSLRRTAVPWLQLGERLKTMHQASEIVVLIDACQSGGITSRELGYKWKDMGVTLITSSTANQFSYESPEFGHGIFTYAVDKGFRTYLRQYAPADSSTDNVLIIGEIIQYAAEEVHQLTGGRQTPWVPEYDPTISRKILGGAVRGE